MKEKMAVFNCPYCGKKIGISSYITKLNETQAKLIDQVKNAISKWVDELDIIEKEGTIAITPKAYLGKDVWHEINDSLKAFNPEWISAGKESRWEIKS